MKVVTLMMVLAVGLLPVESARILAIFPSPAKSHQIVFRALVEGLLDRGHQLTVMSPDPIETNNPNLTQIDWSYAYKLVDENGDVAVATQEKWSSLKVTQKLLAVTEMFLTAELNHPEVQDMIRNPVENFDVVIVEYFQMTPFFAFAELYNAPMIGITSIDSIALAHSIIGNVANAVAHPEMVHKVSRVLSFSKRLDYFITMLFTEYVLFPGEFEKYDRMIEQHFGPNMTKSVQLMNRLDFLMTNVEPALGFVRPTVPRAIQLGFLHVKPPKPLPEDLQQYLDSSKHGVIYFSLGTLIRTKSLNAKNIGIFIDTFRSLKYDVLWKCDGQIDRIEKPSNVRLMRWLPQQDVLAHPNVKLFVTQGGQQSMEEAVDRHVPMVVIPFNFDQFGNGDKVVERGIGKSIWMERLTTDGLRQAILEVIENKKYKRNIERLGKLIRDQPMRPVDKAVWWTEYVIRHQGASHYRYKPAKMPAWQYHYYDVVAFLFTVTVLLVVALAYVVRRFFRFLAGHRWLSTQVKQKSL
uniref:UDP-glucuronosyltransferase n=2 Tax=Culex tarsalis TaxID=7177 RepID=A0A1Q3FQR5_CULTA